MKKCISLFIVFVMIFGFTSAFAEDVVVLLPGDATENSEVSVGEAVVSIENDSYFGFKDVDLTGINSVIMEAELKLQGNHNGEAFRVKIDHPFTGAQIGTVVLNSEKGMYDAYISPTEGKH
ncbi:MAG: hypothetical protein II306_00465, partial [Clostridia bacterium]|nr:hypothetical protein [Clostridia bacterium]